MRLSTVALLAAAAPAMALSAPPRKMHRMSAAPKMLAPATVAAWVSGSVVVGASGALVIVPNLKPWYEGLKKPWWSPPNWLFGPVWTALYALIGLACARTFGTQPLAHPRAFYIFAIHAVLNIAWSPIFFGAHLLGPGFITSLSLLIAAGATALEFARVSGTATGLLLAPYVLWLAYATGLNLRLWQLNP